MRRQKPTRRDWLRLSAAGAFGLSGSRWFPAFAEEAASDSGRKRSCILLWMNGGPSQLDTFDLKPGHPNGGPFEPIDTSVPGLQVGPHLRRLAKVMEHVVPIRSTSTKEGDHSRATYAMRTGYPPAGPVQYPTLGALLSKELTNEPGDLPAFVSIAPNRSFNQAAFAPGFLGPKHAPLVVGEGGYVGNRQFDDRRLHVRNLDSPAGIDVARADARLGLLGHLEDDFEASRPGVPARSHRSAYEQAVRMMRSSAVEAFDLDGEPATLRDAYGRNQFGHGCLLARRLVERGVAFVEVSLSGVRSTSDFFGWDTHQKNFPAVRELCGVLDPAWATLISDLKDRGLLDSTLIVWMGEFGRTPAINGNAGRDHFPAAWSTVLAGGGIRGGQAVGKTSDDGTSVVDRPVSTGDLIATICRALGLDPMRQNMSNVGRPIRLADPQSKPIEEILS